MTTTTTTTANPTLDLTPLLDLRSFYTANAARLLAGVRADDEATVEEARSMLATEDALATSITCAVINIGGGVGNDAGLEIVQAIRATGDLLGEIEAHDTRIGRAAAQTIADRVLAMIATEVRAHEVALGRVGVDFITTEAQRFAEAVVAGWNTTD